MAFQYKRMLIGYAYNLWGRDAPVAALAAQIHQESYWNKNAKSPYACGLAQFTPATMEWMAERFNVTVGPGSCGDASWQLRAQVEYMEYLTLRAQGDTACDKFRIALRGYNGGEGWIQRDQALAKKSGKNAGSADVLAAFNAGRSKAAFEENVTYDKRIVFLHQPLYRTWGKTICVEN